MIFLSTDSPLIRLIRCTRMGGFPYAYGFQPYIPMKNVTLDKLLIKILRHIFCRWIHPLIKRRHFIEISMIHAVKHRFQLLFGQLEIHQHPQSVQVSSCHLCLYDPAMPMQSIAFSGIPCNAVRRFKFLFHLNPEHVPSPFQKSCGSSPQLKFYFNFIQICLDICLYFRREVPSCSSHSP